ncbi:MAG TPA: nitrilase-related carbon-nitrogen hydrolase, partial [Spirochaetota bacterium]|nr:nitrilase-related carbon-nitrogen hydrolase [Spirochaetota bacterium]
FVIAASPARDAGSSYKAYGHSLIADPWGTVLCEAEEDRKIVSAELDADKLHDIRARLPLLKEIGFFQ